MDTVYDFHTHTYISDGALSPLELIRRAIINSYCTIAVTDHAGAGYLERLITETTRDCTLAQDHWNITAIPGVELTHVPVTAIADTARMAKEMGAKLVVVHGETTSEPVEPGTNLAALKSPHVDVLAHPGFLTPEEARLAVINDKYLEITARKSHSATNEHIVKTARVAGAKLIINSDAHDEHDLLTPELACNIAQNAGFTGEEIDIVLQVNPLSLLQKLFPE